MKVPKVSIIIVNYKQKQLTIDCLNSLKGATYPNYEVILVDNNSEDGSEEEIAKKFPSIILIQSGSNTGYTGGNNLGLKYASGDYILLLNNDTKVTPGFIEPLVKDFMKDEKLGIVQSKLFVMDRPYLLDNVVSFQTFNGFLYHEGYLDTDKPKYQNFLYSFSAKGACMMINKKVLSLGLFDDSYFAYFEETDLCWRAWLMGYKVGFEPNSIIYHKMGATSSKMKSTFIHYHSFKNRIRTIIKNSDNFTLLWMLPTHLMLCLSLAIYFLFSEINGTKSIFNAFWWNILNLKDTLRLRKRIQSKRQILDSEIFKEVFKNPPLSFYLKHLSLVKENLSDDRKT